MNDYDEFMSMLSEHSKKVFTQEEGCTYLQPMYDYFRHLKNSQNRAVIVGTNEDLIYKIDCPSCAAKIEYNKGAVREVVTKKYMWGVDKTENRILCPNCKYAIVPDYVSVNARFTTVMGRRCQLPACPPPPPRKELA